MTRKATPDLLVEMDVSRETGDDVALVVGAGDRAGAGRTPQLVGVAFVQDNPYQPRQRYEGIEELAENIRQNGLLQAPVARLFGGSYQLAFGHRRLRAYRLLAEKHGGEWLRIPLVVMTLTDDQMARQAWSENHNREDVSAVEEARLFQRMMADFGFTQQEIADDVGKSRSAVANTLRLLQLPDAAQAMIDAGKITERHGRELLRLAGAPAWLGQFIEDLAGKVQNDATPTVSWLRRAISDHIVRNGTPLPEALVKMASYYGEKEFTAPIWPADYAPRSPDVHGVCAGCALLVTFDREPAGRCTDGKCYMAKDRLWKERERERQKSAAMAAVKPSTPSTNGVTNTRMPEGEGEPAAGGDEETAGGVRWTRKDRYSARMFGSGDAPAGLIERGLCGAEQCECFALMMASDHDLSKDMVGPDRTAAPNAVYVCENVARLRAQRNRLEEIEAPEKAEQRKQAVADKGAETKATKALLRDLWSEIGVDGLSNSQASMATVVAALAGYSYGVNKWEKMAIGELWEELFWFLAGRRCKVGEWTDEGNRADRWVLAKAEQLRDQLRGERIRPESQPGPGDSQRTGWQEGWDEDDEGTWLLLRAAPLPVDVNAVSRPRVLLRAVETADRGTRGLLWRRYNELVGPSTNADATRILE